MPALFEEQSMKFATLIQRDLGQRNNGGTRCSRDYFVGLCDDLGVYYDEGETLEHFEKYSM